MHSIHFRMLFEVGELQTVHASGAIQTRLQFLIFVITTLLNNNEWLCYDMMSGY